MNQSVLRKITARTIVQTTISLLVTIIVPKVVKASSAAGQETLIGIIGKDYVVFGADSSRSSSITLTSSSIDKIRLISNPFPKLNDDHVSHEQGRETKSRQQIIAVAAAGEAADCEKLMGQLEMHASTFEFESGIGVDVNRLFHDGRAVEVQSTESGLDAESIAYFARGSVARAMRTRDRLNACLLIGGMVPTYGQLGPLCGEWATFTKRIQAQVEAATTDFDPSSVSAGTSFRLEEMESHSIGIVYKPKLFWLDEYGSLQNVEYGAHGLGSNFVLSILDRNYKKDLSRDDAVKLIQNCFEQLRSRYVINSPQPPCIKCIDYHGCKMY